LQIQQLNYKITVTLNSDAKSEIEQMRWVLARRAALGIILMALMTLATLRYGSYVTHKREKEGEASRRAAEALRRSDGRTDNSAPEDAAAILAAN